MVINNKPQSTTPSDLRRVHRGLVLRSVFASSCGSRTQLAEDMGLSAMAISRIIRELISAGLIEETGKRDRNGNPGRRQTDLRVKASGAYVVGLVISAFGHEVAVFDAMGSPVVNKKLSFDLIRTADDAVDVASAVILSVIDEAQIDTNRVLGIGIAIAAFVQSATGTVFQAPYLGWKEVKLGQRISELTNIPVIAENIADTINMAEQAVGIVRGIGDIFLVHQSVTCGASYTHQGRVVHGANFSAGQIGHFRTGDSQLGCSCGRTDCLNSHASGWSVLANLGRIESQIFETDKIEDYAKALAELVDENPAPNTSDGEVLFYAGRFLGLTLQQVALIVDPQAIVLAGKLSESSAYVEGCQNAWADSSDTPYYKAPELVVGSVAATRAAGFLALDSFLYSPQLEINDLIVDIGSSEKVRRHGPR